MDERGDLWKAFTGSEVSRFSGKPWTCERLRPLIWIEALPLPGQKSFRGLFISWKTADIDSALFTWARAKSFAHLSGFVTGGWRIGIGRATLLYITTEYVPARRQLKYAFQQGSLIKKKQKFSKMPDWIGSITILIHPKSIILKFVQRIPTKIDSTL